MHVQFFEGFVIKDWNASRSFYYWLVFW